ncbi:MAG: hypothetical protein F6K11_36645 [Leptolyngbya sp. SIO3F4]|nr:hypothetical protein [Leptolyngbya sp. SIO3F4]
MVMWRQVMALMLPLSILGCSTVTAKTPTESPSIASKPASVASLRQVPPGGLDALDDSAFRYFQSMGPLEYATRLGGLPDVPTWRVRLRFLPVQQDTDLLYQVMVDHFNLSPVLYDSLVSGYGEENVDPSLANRTPHQHISLEFLPVMNVAADWLSESTQITESDVSMNPICGLGTGCAELDNLFDSEWSDGSTVALATAPWESDSEPLPMLMRAVAAQAGWLQDGQWTMPNEIPEGISDERPWVEVLVTNYAGNGGGYTAHWIERVADDSVSAEVVTSSTS